MRQHDPDYTNILLEEMRGDIKAILEVVIPMQEKVSRIPKIEEDIAEIKADMRTVKFVLKETNVDVRRHDRIINQFLLSAEGV